MTESKRHLFLLFFLILLGSFGVLIFSYYLYHTFVPFCWRWGYTLCTYRGQDFLALYQSAYNFFHGYFIYGAPAKEHLVTPFFMSARFFPISVLIWGLPFYIIGSVEKAFTFYLYLSVLLHLLSIFLLITIAKKINVSKFILAIVILFWLIYFPLNSEWSIGQYNHLAGMFFLALLSAVIYGKRIFSALAWVLSLSWKPVTILLLPFFIKTKNKLALWLFGLFFIIFTLGYIFYYQQYDQNALNNFLIASFKLDNGLNWQIHYIDNFSINSLIGEIFYDKSYLLWKITTNLYSLAIISVYLVVSWRIKFSDLQTKIYYLLFAASTLLVFHKEVWETWLTFWLPIICVLFLLAKTIKERIFLGIIYLFMATPTLFYFWQIYQTSTWRFYLIAEKALPQLVLYIYVLYKVYKILKPTNKPSMPLEKLI